MRIKNIEKIINKTPSDVRYALGFFIAASLAISFLLLSISRLENTEEKPSVSIELCGFEPYIYNSELVLSVGAEPSVSEQGDFSLLSSACEELFGKESYALRVAFCALILNRCEDSSFPSSVSAVLKSAGIYPESLKKSVSERTLHAVRAAMLGVDPSMGALYMIHREDALFEEYRGRATAILPPYAFIY